MVDKCMIIELHNFYDSLQLYDKEYIEILLDNPLSDTTIVSIYKLISEIVVTTEVLYNSRYNSSTNIEYISELLVTCDIILLDFITFSIRNE